MPKRIIFSLIVLGISLLSLGALNRQASAAAAYVYQTDLYGYNMSPPVNTETWGFVRWFFNQDRSQADYTVDVKGVSNSVVTGADIRRGTPGSNGAVIKHLADPGFIVASGHINFTPAELQDMASGTWYIVLYTSFNPQGEIRGQIVLPSDFFSPNAVQPFIGPNPPYTTPVSQRVAATPVPPVQVIPPPINGQCLADCGGSFGAAPPPPPANVVGQLVVPPPSGLPPGAPVRVLPPNTGDGGLLP